MFEVASSLMIQLIDFIPGYLGLYLIFDFIGSLLFGRS